MTQPLTHGIYQTLTGKVCSDEAPVRSIEYQLSALTLSSSPRILLSTAYNFLELAEREPSRKAAEGAAVALDRTLAKYLSVQPDAKLAPFYERLMLVAQNKEGSPVVHELVNLGLFVAACERQSTARDFFDWTVERLKSARENFTDGDSIKSYRETLAKLGDVARSHPYLATKDYIDMCSSFVNLPLQQPPVEKQYEQPHEITGRQRLTVEAKATNQIIEAFHTNAGSNISLIVNRMKNGKITAPPHELFSFETIVNLEEARARKPISYIAGVNLPVILRDIRDLQTPMRPRSVLLLTYQPSLNPGGNKT